MAFYVNHTAVDINGDRFQLFLSQQLFENLEIDLLQHLGGFVTEIPQKSGYCFRLFDRNSEFINLGITLE
jgi:hypothetical protein